MNDDLDDVRAIQKTRARHLAQVQADTERLTALVLEKLKAGHRPTAVADASGWTGAYIRRLARENGIGPDPRYAERAERMKRR